MELVLAIGALLVLPFWLLMIGLPAWSGTRRIMASSLVLVPLPLLYLIVLAVYGPQLAAVLIDPARPLLDVIADVLGHAEVAAIACLHLLAFDFFVGRWEYLDSQERGIHPLAVVPALWLTLLGGPLGLLLYLPLRVVLGQQRDTRPTSP